MFPASNLLKLSLIVLNFFNFTSLQ